MGGAEKLRERLFDLIAEFDVDTSLGIGSIFHVPQEVLKELRLSGWALSTDPELSWAVRARKAGDGRSVLSWILWKMRLPLPEGKSDR